MCRSHAGSELALAQLETETPLIKGKDVSDLTVALSGAILSVDRVQPAYASAADSDSSSVDSSPSQPQHTDTTSPLADEAARLRAFVESAARRLQAKMDDLDHTGIVIYNAVSKDMVHLREENAKLRAENELLRQEVTSLEHSTVSMYRTFQQEGEDLDFVRKQTSDKLDETRSQLDALAQERDQLQRECARLQQDVYERSEHLKAAEGELEELRHRCADFESELAARATEDENHLKPVVAEERRRSLGSQIAHTPQALTRKLSKTFTQAMPKALRHRLSNPLTAASVTKKSIAQE